MSEETIIKLNVPLFLRLLEYAREDSRSDLDLHFLTERLISLSSATPLTMESYPSLVGEAHE